MIQNSLLAPPAAWYEKNPKPPRVACFMRFSGLYLFRIETDWHDYRDAELAITLPVCSDCRGLNYSHVDENTWRFIFTIIMSVKRAEWLASTKWCLFKGHLSPAAVPVGWACVLRIRRCLDVAAECRWRCLSETSVTFSTGTCHCFEQHSPHQWLLSATTTDTLLIYFPSPFSVCPAGCCCELL